MSIKDETNEFETIFAHGLHLKENLAYEWAAKQKAVDAGISKINGVHLTYYIIIDLEAGSRLELTTASQLELQKQIS